METEKTPAQYSEEELVYDCVGIALHVEGTSFGEYPSEQQSVGIQDQARKLI